MGLSATAAPSTATGQGSAWAFVGDVLVPASGTLGKSSTISSSGLETPLVDATRTAWTPTGTALPSFTDSFSAPAVPPLGVTASVLKPVHRLVAPVRLAPCKVSSVACPGISAPGVVCVRLGLCDEAGRARTTNQAASGSGRRKVMSSGKA